MVETVVSDWALSVTLTFKTAKHSFRMTFWPIMMHHHAKFGYKRLSSWWDIAQMNIHWNYEPFCDLDLDHNRAIQTFHKTSQPMMMYHQTKFRCKRISSSEDLLSSHILITWSFTVTLTLKTAKKKNFLETIWLIMMHHHTKFGSKRLSNSEDIFYTNFHQHFEICCDLDLEHNNPISL